MSKEATNDRDKCKAIIMNCTELMDLFGSELED